MILGGTASSECNPEPSKKRAWKDHNINAKAKEVCDIIVTQMKHCFREATYTWSLAVIELQLFMVHKIRFPSELMSSVVKYCPILSKDKLERELSAVR
jgi:hypothetical protein